MSPSGDIIIIIVLIFCHMAFDLTQNFIYGLFPLLTANIDVVCSAQCQYLTLLSVEVHVATRSDLRPDPEFDEIRAVFYSLHIDRAATATDNVGSSVSRDVDTDGVIVVSHDNLRLLNMSGVGSGLTVAYVDTEIDLLSALTSLVKQYVPLLICLRFSAGWQVYDSLFFHQLLSSTSLFNSS